jgi:UDP-2,3-diacylglucosamine hydrolase
VTDAFHRFLDSVPAPPDHLVVGGDLFDFWFEYGTVVPRAAFRTLSRLAELARRGVAVTVIGGNHDRWGGGFWRDEVGAAFHSAEAELPLAGWRARVAHGDGLTDRQLDARAVHAVARHPWTAKVFRWIHPDLAFPLVRRMSRGLARGSRRGDVLRRSAEEQAAYARDELARRPDIDLLVLGHTHRAALEVVGENRWYLNPGAWMEGLCYAVVDERGPRLERFTSTP